MKITPLLGLSAFAFTLGLAGCKKTETENLFRVKSYPAITLKGNEYTVINVGETFADPGVTATLGGAVLTPIITSNVNTAAPGLYVITYKGANTEGDTVRTVRNVVVTDPAVNNLDQSGNFRRGAFSPSVVTKVGNKGLYRIDNFGFTNAPNFFTAYFVQIRPNAIAVPAQTIENLGYTRFASVASAFNPAGVLTGITYAINAPAIFGPNPRTAVRF